jgi:hypothetical protein
MIKPVFKTLSLSVVVLSAVAYAGSGQSRLLTASTMPKTSMNEVRVSKSEIDLGWELQQRRLDARLAAKAASGALVPGAIIVPPFPAFAPYRTDVPETTGKLKANRNSNSDQTGARSQSRN